MKSFYTVKHLIRKLYAGICIALARRISSHYRPKASHRCSFKHTKFALLISRPHDIELLIDIYHYSLKRSDIEVIFWITNQALIRFPSTKKLMDEEGIQPTFIISHGRLIHAISYLLNIDALLTTVESTVASHKIPYIITKMANACGVRTYTMQHAFENVGLTYQDRELGHNVHFAAQKVLTWGPVDQLPSLVTTETRRKCLTVGCPKVSLTGLQKRNRGNSAPPIIAVFEGLQNKRFDEKYMSSFFNNLQEMACKFSGLRFILKPHPGVMTRSKRHTAFLHSMQHIEVLDPGQQASTKWQSPDLLVHAMAAITTPSTIALDAAMIGTPVAVTRYRQDIPYYAYYEPLPIIDKVHDWINFIETSIHDHAKLKKLTNLFLNRVLLPGNAATRILDIVTENQ